MRLQGVKDRLTAKSGAQRARRKFLRYFPGGFRDQTYREWERDYKWETHRRWEEALSHNEFRGLLAKREYAKVAARAVRTEQQSRHSMIFSFEKMAFEPVFAEAAPRTAMTEAKTKSRASSFS